MNNKTSELANLITSNPNLPIIFMVNSEVVFDDSWTYFLASPSSCHVGRYCCYNERYYDDERDLIEDYYNNNDEDFVGMDDTEIDTKIEEIISSWWRDAIIVYMDVPDTDEINNHK
jgi:hypothetical protein